MSEFETRAIHFKQEPDRNNGAVIPPIYLASTHRQSNIGEHMEGMEYSRVGNPNRNALEEALANLEGAKHGFSFASGMAAEDAIMRVLTSAGDHVVMTKQIYGGTYRLIDKVYGGTGVECDVVDLTDEAALRAAIKPGKTKLIWIESPSNPTLAIVDITAVSKIAHEYGVLTVVDNTFASPYLQRPIELGADIVVHSTTKYLGGHSDLLGGAVIFNSDELAEKFHFLQYATGPVSSPFDAWLTHRSIKTLAVRMERHSSNAQAIAEYLLAHPKVEEVYYPGLPSHPGHDIAKRQMEHGFGGVVSFRLKDEAAARKFCVSTELFILAESLGGIESLVNYPAGMTHLSLMESPIAVSKALVRLAVGLENVKDQIADLAQALG